MVRTIRAGKVVEKSIFPVGRGTKPRSKRKKGSTPPRKRDQNDRDACRRLARTLNCNFGPGDIWVTLTYSPERMRRLLERIAAESRADMEGAPAEASIPARRPKRYRGFAPMTPVGVGGTGQVQGLRPYVPGGDGRADMEGAPTGDGGGRIWNPPLRTGGAETAGDPGRGRADVESSPTDGGARRRGRPATGGEDAEGTAGARAKAEIAQLAPDVVRRYAIAERDRFLRRVKRDMEKQGMKLRYVASTSDIDGRTGELVRVHHHLVVQKEAFELLFKHWSREEVHYRPLRDQDDYTPVAEYIIRQVRRQPDAKKYTCSRNLKKPEVTEVLVRVWRELRPPAGAKLLHRGEYDEAAAYQYIRYVVPPSGREKAGRGRRRE